jgi:hypothetical protein
LEVWDDFVFLERSTQIVRVFSSHGNDDTTAGRQVIQGIFGLASERRGCGRLRASRSR